MPTGINSLQGQIAIVYDALPRVLLTIILGVRVELALVLFVILFAKVDLPLALFVPLLNSSKSIISSLLLLLRLLHHTIVNLCFQRFLKLGGLRDNLFFLLCQIVIKIL